MKDMADGKSCLGKRARYQQTPMAIQRLALGTHQADALFGCQPDQLPKPRAKVRLSRHRLVISNPVAIKADIARSPAEGIAHRQISDFILLQPRRKVFAGEPWTKPGDRIGAHIGQNRHSSRSQHPDERLGGDV